MWLKFNLAVLLLFSALLGGAHRQPHAAGCDVALRLSTSNPTFRVGGYPRMHITVTNNGIAPVTLVRPGDGSLEAWRTPVVSWSVLEGETGGSHPAEPVPSEFRGCGNLNSLRPEEVFTLAPGETKELTELPINHQFRPGTHRVMFLYANKPTLGWRGIPLGEHDPQAMERVRGSSACTLSSNEVVLNVIE